MELFYLDKENMGKIIKIVASTIISIALITVITGTAIIILIDPNEYKNKILTMIEMQTGSKFMMGKVKWGMVGSNLGLVIRNVSLITNPAISQIPIFEIDKMELGLDILPLLHKKVSINRMIIEGGKFKLTTNGAQNNWSFPNNSKLEKVNYSLKLHEIKILNSSFSYNNTVNNLSANLQQINLNLSPTIDGNISYYAQSDLLSLNNVKFNLNDTVSGELDLSYADDLYNINYTTTQFSFE